uniref:Nucleoporin Nup153 N-terminal domain-containing protein n=2 Tax=Lygus hesperus TaxID=30085 RepID=A0A0A9XAK5_LYGHE
MAKGSNNVNPKRSHLYKPYNSANSSLFSRLTTRVSEILPQPTSWLSRWTAPVEQRSFRVDSDEDEDDSNEQQQQPPSKRMCVRPTSNDVSTQQNENHVRQIRCDPELSPILRNRSDQPDGEVAGPSGLNLRGANFVASTPAVQVPTEAPVKVNGDEGSDGSESTSGCSSLVPQGERTLTAPFPENTPKASPETPMLSMTPNSLGGKRAIKTKNRTMDLSYSFTKSRPSFDAYAFNNPLNKSSSFSSSFNRTLDDSTTSPFYRGRTMYGGNSSCKESLSLSLSSPKVGTPRLVSVRPTPTPLQNRDTISTSALKILRAIEQFSTPVLDTKKIPLKSESERRKRKAPQPFEDLVIPTMPDLLRIKRKERSTSESSGAPSTPSTSNTPKPYQLPPPIQPLSVRDDAPEPKRVMKGKHVEEMKSEQAEKVNLPSIPLPIKTLPSFSHLSSLPTSSTYSTPATASYAMFSSKPVLTTSPSQTSPLFSFGARKTNESSFKFSRPSVESDTVVPIPSIKPKLQFRNPLKADATPKSKEPSTAADIPVLQLKNNQR